MKEASTLIRKRRERQGAMSLQSVELKFKVDENGIPYQVDKQISAEAEKMIEDFMIACNCSVAKLLKENDIPVLYRVHDNPPSDKIIAFKDFIRKIDPQLRNSFPKSDNITASSLNEFLNKMQKLMISLPSWYEGNNNFTSFNRSINSSVRSLSTSLKPIPSPRNHSSSIHSASGGFSGGGHGGGGSSSW